MARHLPVLLIVGCGEVGLRVARLARGRWRVRGTTTDPERCAVLRAAGVQPVLADLDQPHSLAALARALRGADALLHLASPPNQGEGDPRVRRLLALARRQAAAGGVAGAGPQVWLYASTSGVYGDCGGAWVAESRPPQPATARGRRRLAAEQAWRKAARQAGRRALVLRIPGIYALDRPGGDPRERLRAGRPVPRPEDDVHTNHVHAHDLARACLLALRRGAAQRIYHVCDDNRRSMGDHFEHVAALCRLPPPPRLSRAQLKAQLSPMQMSFLSESRRLENRRMKRELRLVLRYPEVAAALRESGDLADLAR